MKSILEIAVTIAVLVVAGVVSAIMMPKGGADPDDAKQVALGDKLNRAHCASCHGVNLEGDADWRTRNADGTLKPPPHDASGHTWHHPGWVLFDYTKQGRQAAAAPGFKSAMPGFAGTLSDAQIWAVLSYIKSRWPEEVRQRHHQINQRNR